MKKTIVTLAILFSGIIIPATLDTVSNIQNLWVLDKYKYSEPTNGNMSVMTYVDPQTGVNYLIVEDRYNGISVSITPRLTKEGNLYITERGR